MIKNLIALGAISSLLACGSGEFLFDDGEEETETETAAATSTYTGEVNKLEYDADADQVVINNLPFDGPDGVYNRVAARTEIDGFGVYRSVQTEQTGQRTYYAVFRSTENGAASVVATPDYRGFGFGGAAMSRTNDLTVMPTTGEYVYRGLYGGLRTFGDRGGIELVEGDVLLEIDIADFDDTGAVEGRVINRVAYNVDGVPLQPLPTIIFATTSIDLDTGAIKEGTASTANADGTARDTGTYQGLFVGPDGKEIVGTVDITGNFTSYRIIETVQVTAADGTTTEEERPLTYQEYLDLQAAGSARLDQIEITETSEGFQVRERGAFTAAN